MIKVAVGGALGRMGSEVIDAIAEADGLEVVACVDPLLAGAQTYCDLKETCRNFDDLSIALDLTKPDVYVDFTRPDAVEENLRTALSRNVDCVVGTTGLSDEILEELAQLGDEEITLFVAPNFAIGAVLMMEFAARASKVMEKAEIIELHHDRKLDAPSGTALRTASLMAGDPPIHSVRLPGLVAHQEVILGDVGQTLTIRHDSIDRRSFMPGVILACKKVAENSGLIVGLENFLDTE
jgi:4-hydroxy-tetrahydrodipicolinate reductase